MDCGGSTEPQIRVSSLQHVQAFLLNLSVPHSRKAKKFCRSLKMVVKYQTGRFLLMNKSLAMEKMFTVNCSLQFFRNLTFMGRHSSKIKSNLQFHPIFDMNTVWEQRKCLLCSKTKNNF